MGTEITLETLDEYLALIGKSGWQKRRRGPPRAWARRVSEREEKQRKQTQEAREESSSRRRWGHK